MADYFTEFSTYIPYANDAQRDWLLAALQKANTSTGSEICKYEDHPKEHGIWVASEDYGNCEALAAVVSAYQRRYKLTTPWTLGWANTVSRPIVDSFSGGALCVYRGKSFYAIPEDTISIWLRNQGWKNHAGAQIKRRPS